MKYALVKREKFNDNAPYWHKDCIGYWEDVYGCHWDKEPNDKVFEYIESDDLMISLDWTKTGFLVPDGKSGWLAPNGTFYGCHFCGHNNLATYVIRQEWSALEEDGWCHINEAGRKGMVTFLMDGEPTEAQKTWLTTHNHDLDPNNTGKHIAVLVDPIADKRAFEKYMAAAPKKLEIC